MMLRCMMVLNTICWKCLRTSSTTWFDRRRRASYMVSKNPSICSAGLSRVWIILMVLSSLPSPSRAKYSHCTGIITVSAAVSAFTVIRPSEGEQSIRMKSYSSRTLSITDFSIFSRLGVFSISISAPTRSMCEGIRSSPFISLFRITSRGFSSSLSRHS